MQTPVRLDSVRHLAAAARAACALLFALLLLLARAGAPVAYASTIAVNSILDPSESGKCTLHDAILAANNNVPVNGCPAGLPFPAVDTINVGFARIYCLLNPCTIILNGPLPTVTEDVVINGVSNLMRVSGANQYRVFDLAGVNATISNLQIISGNAVGVGTAGYGGGINTSGTILTVIGVTLYNNHAQTRGGAVSVPSGTVSISNSTLISNTVDAYGGAIDQIGGVLILSNSTLAGNSAADGGGLEIQSASETRLTNVTFSGNRALNNGGAISRIGTTYNVSLNNVTITNNTADSDNNGSGSGGGIYRAGGNIVVSNSILAGNFDTANNAGPGTIHADCDWPLSGGFTSFGYNLIGRGDGCAGFTNGVNGDIVGSNANPVNALLAPLASNGGPTQTHALIHGSPAIDFGGTAVPGSLAIGACVATDQRGVARPVGPRCDIGAFEGEVAAPPPPTATNVPLFLPFVVR